MDGWEEGSSTGHVTSEFSESSRPRSTKKFVSKLEDIPNTECWVIVSQTNVHIPGDERSRQAPGHGYPEHTESYVTIYEVFTNEEEFKEVLAIASTKYRGFKVTPYVTKTTVEVIPT
jgi:hypothetical protein